MKKLFLLLMLVLGDVGYVQSVEDGGGKEYQESTPEVYDTGSSFQRFLSWTDEKTATAQEILDVVGEKKESLLDIGAGNGMLTKLIAGNFDHVVAIEPSESLFKELQGNFLSEKHKLVNETFENAKLDGQKFDVILASHVFQYMENPLERINYIKEHLLKSDGVFILVTNEKESGFGSFYNKYLEDILGAQSDAIPVALNYNFGKLLKQVFSIEKLYFTVTISISSVQDTIGIFDFLYNVDFDQMQPGSLERAKIDLEETYGSGQVILTFEDVMYVCKKGFVVA